MAKKQKDQLMLTKEEIHKAIEQSQQVKKHYPEFWKFHLMLQELNVASIEKLFEEKK